MARAVMPLLPRLVLAIGISAGRAAAFVPGGGMSHAPSVHVPSPRSKAPSDRGADVRAPSPPKPAHAPLRATPAQDAADMPYSTDAPPPLFVSPRRASAVINEWAQDVARDVARDKYSPYKDTSIAHLLHGTQNVLDQMNRTVGEGIPEHVFALTDSKDAEDIRAMATVSTHGGAAGGRGEVVDIRELVARPTARASKHIAELVRGIHGWARGRFIAISRNEKLEDYYEDLGYEPEDNTAVADLVSSGALLKEPADGRGYRMTELVLDTDYLKAAKSQALVDHRPDDSTLQDRIHAMSTESTKWWLSNLGTAMSPTSGDQQSMDDI